MVLFGVSEMTDEEKRKSDIEKCDKINRKYFPELYPETRFQVPNESVSRCPIEFFSEIIGLNIMFARDRNNSVKDRIAASDVARKATVDQMGIARQVE